MFTGTGCHVVGHGWGGRGKVIEDSSWLRVEDKDIFSKRVTEKPSDEGARFFCNTRGKDIRSSTSEP